MMFKKKIGNHTKEYGQPKPNKRAKKVIAAILASLTGISAMTVVSGVIAYDTVFQRYKRPDYATYPGEYLFERVKDGLSRTEFYYRANKSELKGYYYPAQNGKGLVVIAHGFHAGADDYLPMIAYMVRRGYNVFAYDNTGTYDSKGEWVVGMCQALVDLDNTLSYLKATPPYNQMPVFLLGHSMGGYAVTSVLALQKHVRACAAIAPMNNGYTIMLEKGEQYVGKLALTAAPVFNVYQKMLFGEYAQYNGVKGINSVDIPVLIAHGVDDKVITYSEQSVIAHKDEITNKNVSYYVGKGLQGDHDNIWHSVEAAAYQSEVASGLKLLKKQKGDKMTREEIAAYSNTVDHAKYSAVNKELFEEIIKLFDGALAK